MKAVVSRAVRLGLSIKRASTVNQTLETVFHHNFKLLEVRQLCSRCLKKLIEHSLSCLKIKTFSQVLFYDL